MLKKEWKKRLLKIQDYFTVVIGPMAEWRGGKIHIRIVPEHSYMGCRFGTACGGLDLFVEALEAGDVIRFPEKHVEIIFEDKVLTDDDLEEFYYLVWEYDSFNRRKHKYFSSLDSFAKRFS